MNASATWSPLTSPTLTPSVPGRPGHAAALKSVPVDRFTVHVSPRHMNTSERPSPLRSPTLIGPSEPHAPCQICALNPVPVDRFTVHT